MDDWDHPHDSSWLKTICISIVMKAPTTSRTGGLFLALSEVSPLTRRRRTRWLKVRKATHEDFPADFSRNIGRKRSSDSMPRAWNMLAFSTKIYQWSPAILLTEPSQISTRIIEEWSEMAVIKFDLYEFGRLPLFPRKSPDRKSIWNQLDVMSNWYFNSVKYTKEATVDWTPIGANNTLMNFGILHPSKGNSPPSSDWAHNGSEQWINLPSLGCQRRI